MSPHDELGGDHTYLQFDSSRAGRSIANGNAPPEGRVASTHVALHVRGNRCGDDRRVELPVQLQRDNPLTPSGHTMFFASSTDDPFAPGAISHLYVSERQNDNA